jgi:uncharacterized protein (DUF305 family)
MGRYGRRWPLAALALILSACGSATASSSTAGPAPRPSPDGLTPEEMEAIYHQRIEQDRQRFTPADVHFMTSMIHHHAQAVELSNLVPERTTSASIRTLAARIINAQMDEIAIMQRWLRERGQTTPELHVMDGRVMVHGHEGHDMDMPGMIPPAQVRELEQARGAEFDRLFLTRMIEHHRGAVRMVYELFSNDGAGQDEEVFKFASDVQVDQTTEVNRMERMLAALPAPGSD